MAWRLGKPLDSNSFIQWLGEEKYQDLADFCLRYISNIKLPKKRGTFIEFRNGMINVSPIGRNASIEERNEFEAYVYTTPKKQLCSMTYQGIGEQLADSGNSYDKIHNIRRDMVEALKKEFPDYGLT